MYVGVSSRCAGELSPTRAYCDGDHYYGYGVGEQEKQNFGLDIQIQVPLLFAYLILRSMYVNSC